MPPNQDVNERDWKYLILFDACRYDYFKDVNYLDGSLIKVDSECKHTGEWYEHNWNDEFIDTALLSSHSRAWNDGFVENFGFSKPLWDKGSNPHYVLSSLKNVPDMDRYVLHLSIPHLPFIGNKGKKFLEEVIGQVDGSPDVYMNVQDYGRENGWEELIEYYKENILVGLDAVDKYNHLFDGKAVITSDHGELIGEENRYDHNRGRKDILQYVPWFELEE